MSPGLQAVKDVGWPGSRPAALAPPAAGGGADLTTRMSGAGLGSGVRQLDLALEIGPDLVPDRASSSLETARELREKSSPL